MSSKIVLITGCSTGIGRDLALRLAQADYTVVATARRPDALVDLQAALKLHLDVTDPVSIANAAAEVMSAFGRVDVLVNNAGYALRGTVEEVSIAQVEKMFDANVYGVMRMIQAFAPILRQQRAGRIINIGSIAGKLSTPVNGAYSATKFALEALSDAARIELAPFGIQVVLVEPGSIDTPFHTTAQAAPDSPLDNPGSPYQALYQRYLQVTQGMRKGEPGPEVVSRVIQQAIEAPRPKARYLAGAPATVRLILSLGDSFWDMALRSTFKFDAPLGLEPRPENGE